MITHYSSFSSCDMSDLISAARLVDGLALATGLWLLYLVLKSSYARSKTTKLNGPPSSSWLFGVSKEVLLGDSGALFEKWASTHGSVYQVAGPLGERRVVLTDPKAISHVYARMETFIKSDFDRIVLDKIVRILPQISSEDVTIITQAGKGVIYVEGMDHRR